MRGPPPDWPLAERSSHHRVPPHDWHVQEMGQGPTVLLIHGSGGATHSWRDVMPLLAARGRHVAAVDLPGQGFTRAGRPRFALHQMAADLAALCLSRDWRPAVIVGHSAGAAIALRMALDGIVRPGAVVGVNAALGSFEGPARIVFPLVAKALVANPLAAFALSRFGTERRARRMIESMGSAIDDRGIAGYAHLFADRGHVGATLRMMAAWDLVPLRQRLGEVAVPVLLIVGEGDRAVPPSVSRAAAGRLPDARVEALRGGHLVHEEAPEATADLIAAFGG